MRTIHFICRGNVLRSLIAETYLKSLRLKNIDVISSGTNVNWDDPQEKEFFNNTLVVLKRHGINSYAKAKPEQLNKQRIDTHHDITILMNQRVVDEASKIVTLPAGSICWDIVDVGEGHRIDNERLKDYEEEIYKEITYKVDELVKSLR
ncbi:MAG: hypothetical protein WAR37_04420 [Candidatus Microsaccharimonas sp.]